MRSSAIHYDSTGRSLGTAHVVFTQYPSALKASRQYNGVHLDGRPMKITIDGQNPAAQAVAAVGQRGGFRGTSNRRPVKRLSGTPTAFKGELALLFAFVHLYFFHCFSEKISSECYRASTWKNYIKIFFRIFGYFSWNLIFVCLDTLLVAWVIVRLGYSLPPCSKVAILGVGPKINDTIFET